MLNFNFAPQLAYSFFLVLARVGGLMAFAPFLGSASIPRTVRISLSLAFALVLFPVIYQEVPAVESEFLPFLLTLAGELVIGILLGLIGQIFMAALQMSGQIMGFQMGFSIINVIDPETQVETPVLGTLQSLTGIVIFLIIDAHHWFIQAIFESYRLMGPTSVAIKAEMVDGLIDLTSRIFLVGFELAAPVVIVLILLDILLGIIGRAAPQIHVLIVGMPLKLVVGLLFLGGSAGVMLPAIARFLGGYPVQLDRFIGLLR